MLYYLKILHSFQLLDNRQISSFQGKHKVLPINSSTSNFFLHKV